MKHRNLIVLMAIFGLLAVLATAAGAQSDIRSID